MDVVLAALHLAAEAGHSDCLRLLLLSGADPMAKNKVSVWGGGQN